MNKEIYDRLHSFEIEQFNSLYRENEAFRIYAKKVYGYCCEMKPGTCINLTRYSGQKLEWTLLTIATFYCAKANYTEFYMTDDYTRFARKK